MAERSAEPPKVRLEFAFDRLLSIKLQQVYELLVPDRIRSVGQTSKEKRGDDHEVRGDLREGLLRQTEGGTHHRESNGSAPRFRAAARLQRSR